MYLLLQILSQTDRTVCQMFCQDTCDAKHALFPSWIIYHTLHVCFIFTHCISNPEIHRTATVYIIELYVDASSQFTFFFGMNASAYQKVLWCYHGTIMASDVNIMVLWYTYIMVFTFYSFYFLKNIMIKSCSKNISTMVYCMSQKHAIIVVQWQMSFKSC